MTQAVVCIVRVRTCNFERRFPPERKSNIEHIYIYDFDPKAVQSSSAGL